jgi:hypothetical protein
MTAAKAKIAIEKRAPRKKTAAIPQSKNLTIHSYLSTLAG